MTLDMWIVLAILVGAIILFITEWVRVDVVALGVMISLMLTGVLTPSEALSGFSSSSVITIAALFVVGGAVMHTGLASVIGRQVLTIAGRSEIRLIVVLMTAVALLSGFMSNTGTVAVLLPAVVALAAGAKIAPSRLLMPLAFGASLGGAMTLIGTPPNIIVSDMLAEAGMEPFGFFAFMPMGLILLVAGLIFMVLIGRKLLPNRTTNTKTQSVTSPKELVKLYSLPDDMMRLRVRRGSPLIGKQLEGCGLRHDYNVNVLKIMRHPEPRRELSLVGRNSQTSAENGKKVKDVPVLALPETVIELDDALIVKGSYNDITAASSAFNLAVQPPKPKDAKALVGHEVGIAEVVLPPRSRLICKTLVGLRFGSAYKLTVLNIFRPSTKKRLDLKTTKLEFGDTLLVQGPWENIVALRDKPRDFVVLGQPESMLAAPHKERAPLALLIMLAMVIVLVANVMPTATASLLAGLLMILTGCLTIDEAYESIDWKSIVLIAGMLPMSLALEKVGLVDLIATGLSDSSEILGPVLILGAIFLITALLTQVISNTATAVILAPVALASAQQMGLAPEAFLMAVAVSASMGFASPVASPVNTLVMGAGNYRFFDYVKVGVPLIVLTLILSVIFLPILFPF